MRNRLIFSTQSQVSKLDREAMLGQAGVTFWLTGLSGSGKSTLAYAFEHALFELGKLCVVLDGDNIRSGLNNNLGFSLEDRAENIRRVAEVAKLMNDVGVIVVVAFISPTRDGRDNAKKIIGDHKFMEVFVDADLTVCEARDPKGLYARARRGDVKDFTGITSLYEKPIKPDVHIDTSVLSVKDSLDMLLKVI